VALFTVRARNARVWIVAGGVLVLGEICSALVRHYVPVLNIHWVLKPILGIANAPTDEGYLGTVGVVARLLHAGVIVLAAAAWLWLASKVGAPVRPGWYVVGQGLFIGGAAANAYQLLVTGRVLDWITFRPLVALDLHEGLTTYSLGDVAAASGFTVLIIVVLMRLHRTSMSGAKRGKTDGSRARRGGRHASRRRSR
jgi:lipoprotein signal peptidase